MPKKMLIHPLILVLIVLLFSCTSKPIPPQSPVKQAMIQGNELNISLVNGLEIHLWSIKDEILRVRAETKDTPYQGNDFTLELTEASGAPSEKDGNFSLGEFVIRPIAGGFRVSKGGTDLYESTFTYNKETENLTETRNSLKSETFYGMGGVSNSLNLSSRSFRIYQKAAFGNQTFMYIPYYFSSGGDAFYTNAGMNDVIGFGESGTPEVTIQTAYGHLDYYYYYETNLKKNVAQFYKMSNSKGLLPLWAYGYIQSKYGYKSQYEVETLIQSFEEKKIPLSAVVLDLYWFKRMGDLDWDRDAWPNPEKLDAQLEKKGIKLITITEPYYTEDSASYKEFSRANLFVENEEGTPLKWSSWWTFDQGDGSMINLWANGASDLLGKKYIAMMKTGIDGFWTDLGEPEESPDDAVYSGMKKSEIHNYYNREWSRIIHDAALTAYPDRRAFILSRSGFTGSTRYGVSVWSGDVSSNFQALATQPALGMGAGLAGFPYWGSDVGGFVSKGLPDREVWIRWQQLGLFTPVYRAHGSQSPREPWILPGEPERIVTAQIQKRYELLPYIYSTAYQSWKDGVPMMRPIFLENQDWEPAYKQNSAFYFGDALLVFPISQSIKNQSELNAELPPGDWYDFYSWTKQASGAIKIPLTIEHLPVYVKSGAIIPQNINGRSTLTFIPTEKSNQFTWFLDDGVSNDYLKGLGEKRVVTLEKGKLKIQGVQTPGPLLLQIPSTSVASAIDWEEIGSLRQKTVTLQIGDNEFELP